MLRRLEVAVVLIVLQVGKPVWSSYAGDVENLRGAIFSSTYGRMTRPQESVTVYVQFNLVFIANLNVKEHYLDSSGWFRAYWTDSRLIYASGISTLPGLHAVEGDIWRPELVVENTLSNTALIAPEHLSYRVKSDGSVVWEPPVYLRTLCTTDVTFFPFDKHTCEVTVSSWSLDASEMTLVSTRDTVDTTYFTESSEWILESTSARQVNYTDVINSDTKVYSKLEFTLTLKRRTQFYGLCFFLPLIVLSALSVLVFCIPTDSGEKFTYKGTVILAIFVCYGIILDYLPASKSISLMAIYMATLLVLSLIVVVLELFVTKLYHTDPKEELSSGTKDIANTLARLSFSSKYRSERDEVIYNGKDNVSSGLTTYVNGTLGPELPAIGKKAKLPPVDTSILKKNKVRPKSDSSVKNVQKVSIQRAPKVEEVTFKEVAEIWERFFFLLFGVVYCVANFSFICAICIGGSV